MTNLSGETTTKTSLSGKSLVSYLKMCESCVKMPQVPYVTKLQKAIESSDR